MVMNRILLLVYVSFVPAASYSQNHSSVFRSKELVDLIFRIEEQPDNLDLHRDFTNKFDVKDSLKLEEQYSVWMKTYPSSAVVPFAIGHFFLKKENHKSKDYLFKAVQIDSMFVDAWYDLALDALMRENNGTYSAYLRKCVEIKPREPKYSFMYVMSLDTESRSRRDSLLLDLELRFSNTNWGCEALCQLAYDGETLDIQKSYYNFLFNRYRTAQPPPFRSGMSSYFLTLLQNGDYTGAFDLALNMIANVTKNKLEWKHKLEVAKGFLKYNDAFQKSRYFEALKFLKGIELSNSFSASIIRADEHLVLQMAETYHKLNDEQHAYDLVINRYLRYPTILTKEKMYFYGKNIHKDTNTVDYEIHKLRLSKAIPASEFSLANYLTGEKVNLSDYKGQLVLLTYWFPGCGPCRAEFPYFEKIFKKFKGKGLNYLGVNVYSSQDQYVAPFLKANNYSFIPLKDDVSWDKGSLKLNGAPTNYLIDGDGLIVYSGFQINKFNPDALELVLDDLIKFKENKN